VTGVSRGTLLSTIQTTVEEVELYNTNYSRRSRNIKYSEENL
jgi:hypothetical protein